MKKTLLPLFLLFTGSIITAQQDIFALTGKDTPNIVFNDFRSLNFNGNSDQIIFSDQSTPSVYSQILRKQVNEDKASIHHSQTMQMAGLAYASSGDLVYTPLFSSNIYVLNTVSGKIKLVENNVIKTTPCDMGSHITRMAAGYDGNIYTLNNSGSQMIRISQKNGEYTVTDLGALKNDPSNGNNRFDVMNVGYGGDMIADAENNFYVFSASGNVFKIFTADLNAQFLGKVNGLPENYTVNGAAVNELGNVVIASAKGQSFYEVNLKDLSAKSMDGPQNMHVYDLASKYFANDRKIPNVAVSNEVNIYPTNIKEKFFNLAAPNTKGALSVEVYDFSGKRVMQKEVTNAARTAAKIELNNLNSGVFVVTVKDEAKNIILTKKIIISE
ncbi:T9SS type A sorting domain-containing protein [Chryseobacterium sp.]|uniref:T9SS type A sorting domain-containing protein n=1 Tax=Chryseobacterium sp. TaxID=1871047 RepID=UPI0011C83C24|nr:T9SS type A sorting domain-containing protein [Chryseobacterium sp.]TXF76321.1 T9SS type A sorting domain-containing protein [Chryseobacterium sp.]